MQENHLVKFNIYDKSSQQSECKGNVSQDNEDYAW